MLSQTHKHFEQWPRYKEGQLQLNFDVAKKQHPQTLSRNVFTSVERKNRQSPAQEFKEKYRL
jgi:hypothetical protein